MFSKVHRQYPKRVIENEPSILWILADTYSRIMLKNIKDIPKSAMEISADTKIPISTVYRRVQTLQDLGLVNITGCISEDGKKYFLYKSKIKSIQAAFEDKLDVKITYR